MSKGRWVYIVTNRYRGTIYIGVTGSLSQRTMQHRDGTGSKFAGKYGCDRLVFAEHCDSIDEAIAREKQIKKWNREWKIRLIEEQNPDWEDRFDHLIDV
ncbi:GIY-YIG nuclease family protein [Pontixanthobacter aestiaquae]|uniref:GIY-YIG nuclease family protein n=1 Tax=Pontixanthobacter aestiaquae TaxID=1509367 RepID=A0A844Z7J1_9SPHN|nr:GIY-YIG nuclease family protein [Pontixanthobacter aestiaquae]MDN3645220.1 GIY-YIG nuclease family protein [Pontixanthobacter aestiaquae]MXO83778.1 GIY-YIG nuclease family protein [Pontixanthobacter aestiaquae]